MNLMTGPTPWKFAQAAMVGVKWKMPKGVYPRLTDHRNRWTHYDPMDAFWKQVEKTDTCWAWTGFLDKDGYGIFGSKVLLRQYNWGKRAHRIAWLSAGWTIPEGLVLDHLCRNRACVRISHLEVVTVKENTIRGHAARKAAR